MTDRGDRRPPLAASLAWRYLRGKRSRLLQRTALAAFASVALGVTAMVVAMALMTGYRQDLESKLVAGNAAVLVYPLASDDRLDPEATVDRLAGIPGVTAVTRVAYGQGTAMSRESPEGIEVTLRGAEGDVGLLERDTGYGIGAEGVPEGAVGADLASRLGVGTGDPVRLVVLGFPGGRPRFAYRTVRVGGIFRSGFAEFDARWIVLPRSVVEELVGGLGGTSLFEVAVSEPSEAPVVAERARELVGPDVLVTDWKELNRELFAALELQQLGLFFLLGLIVIVSTFNVASTLVVLVRERLRDVGVLVALGLDRRRLMATFLLYGTALGVAGTAVGLLAGSGISWILTELELIRFDPEVAEIYFVRSVSFRVEIGDLAAVSGFSLLVTVLSSLVPAWRASGVAASDALRYE